MQQLKALTVSRIRLCAEIGESETKHIQGAITFKRAYRLAALKKLFPSAHWEIAKTNDPENYCIKGELLYDVQPEQRKRSSGLSDARDLLCNGKRLRDVAIELPDVYMRHWRGLERWEQVRSAPTETYFETRVTVLWGDSGVGKSRRAREAYPDIYNVAEPEGSVLWFDGYCGQEAILLDDFYGWIKYHRLLQLLDVYPLRLQVKGGWVERNWKTVIITSNKHPDQWYASMQGKMTPALDRRLHKIEEMRWNV